MDRLTLEGWEARMALRVRPGETLLVTLDRDDVTRETLDEIVGQLKEAMPRVRVAVMVGVRQIASIPATPRPLTVARRARRWSRG